MAQKVRLHHHFDSTKMKHVTEMTVDPHDGTHVLLNLEEYRGLRSKAEKADAVQATLDLLPSVEEGDPEDE